MKWTAVLAAAAVMTLSACGARPLTELEEAQGKVTDTPVPAEEKAKDVLDGIEEDAELKAMLPDGVRERGLKWATSVGYPPMELWTSDNSEIIGVDPAMAHAISKKLGVSMSIENQEFASLIPGLISKRYDVMISSTTDNEERRKTTTFVDYVQAGNAFLVYEGNPEGIEKPDDLCGKTIALVANGSSFERAKEFSKNCEDSGKPPYKILSFEDDNNANLAVQSRRATATVTDFPVAAYRAADEKNKMAVVPIEGDEAVWGIGIDNSRTDLVDPVYGALSALVEDGTYGEILKAWDVELMAVGKVTVNLGEHTIGGDD